MQRRNIIQKNTSKAGFSLVESIIAIAILGILLACVTVMMATASRYNAAAAQQHQKVDAAYNKVEDDSASGTFAISTTPQTTPIAFEITGGGLATPISGSAFSYIGVEDDVTLRYFKSKQLFWLEQPSIYINDVEASSCKVGDTVKLQWTALKDETNCSGYKLFYKSADTVSPVTTNSVDVLTNSPTVFSITITEENKTQYANAQFAVAAVATSGAGYADSPLSPYSGALTIQSLLTPVEVVWAYVGDPTGIEELKAQWKEDTSGNCKGYIVHVRYVNSQQPDGLYDWSSSNNNLVAWTNEGYTITSATSGSGVIDIAACAGGTLYIESVAATSAYTNATSAGYPITGSITQ